MMHRPLPVRQRFVAEGGLRWWCMHRSASLPPSGRLRTRSASLPRSLGARLVCPPRPAGLLAWPPAFLMQGYDSCLAEAERGSNSAKAGGFSCLANFAPTQNAPNTLRPQPRKNSLKLFLLFYIGGGEKFIKGVFARFRSPQPPVVIHRRKAGGWEAESFLDMERGRRNIPPTQSSLCARGSSAFGVFACLRSKPAFPLKGRRNLASNIHQHFCLFFKKPEQFTMPKDISPLAKRLLPFGFALL